MADNLNISVLCAAKEEYTNQLKHYLTPLIQEGFVSIYDDARENDEENVLRQFQIYLKQIPRWNQTILEQETKRIKDRCPFLMDLVTAIFVSHVKILASVRLGGNHGNIKIKIPTSDIFIHSIYVNAAEKIFYEPHPFRDLSFSRKNAEIVKDIIDETVEDTISSMIPIQSILQEYLSSAFSEHTKPDPQPDPPPEAPFERQITGTDIANEVSTKFVNEINAASTANEVADFGTMHNHFSIGDTTKPSSFAPIEVAEPPRTSFAPVKETAPIDLGETLDATSIGSSSDAPVVEDNSFGNAFSSDFGEPAVKSIPITGVFKNNPFGSEPHQVADHQVADHQVVDHQVVDQVVDHQVAEPEFNPEPSSDQSFFYNNDDVAILE